MSDDPNASPGQPGGEGGDDFFIEDEAPEGDEPEGEEPEGDEPEPSDDGGEPEPVEGRQPAPQRQGRRGEAHRWRERYEGLAREVAELKGRLSQPAPAPQVSPAEQQRIEAEKWQRRAEMSPVELVQDVQREVEARVAAAFQQQHMQTQDLIDRQNYEALSTTNRAAATYRDRVEDLVQRERARGVIVGREQAFAWLWYQDQKKRLAAGGGRQSRAAAARVEAARGRPTGARSDAGRGGRPAAGSAAADDAMVEEYFRSGGRL